MQAMEDGSDERAPPDPTQLTLQDLEPHFCTKTIHEAARAMGVGLTALKRRCRALGIKRWPFRMLSSIAKMMDQVKKEGENKELEKNEREDKQYTLELLQEYYDNLRQHPDEPVEKDVLQDVMRIRQAFFKQTHNQKKGSQQSTKARRPVQPQELPFSFGENW